MPKVAVSEERKFWKGLCKVFQKLIDDVKAGSGLVNGMNQNIRQFMNTDEVDGFLRRIVRRMVKNQRDVSARSWREAATKAGNGPELYKLIIHEMNGPVGVRVDQLVSENAALIKTLPDEWARYVAQYCAREALKGKRPDVVQRELAGILPDHMTKNLKCIARTECAKANAAIVQARAEMCGVRAYFWRCVKDERSRDSHIGMDGVLCFYDDPPNPEALFPGKNKPYGKYHAGNTFNCRCFQEPVVDVMFLPDVMRVHDHGRIYTTTKGHVLRTYGNIA